MEIARYEKRLWGWAIDKALSLLLFVALLILEIHFFPPDFSLFLEILFAYFASYIFYILFGSITMFLSHGATMGMLIARIHACHASGEKLRYSECFLKCLMTGLVAFDLANSIYMLSSHTERSVFDRLTSTLVVEKKRH